MHIKLNKMMFYLFAENIVNKIPLESLNLHVFKLSKKIRLSTINEIARAFTGVPSKVTCFPNYFRID